MVVRLCDRCRYFFSAKKLFLSVECIVVRVIQIVYNKYLNGQILLYSTKTFEHMFFGKT